MGEQPPGTLGGWRVAQKEGPSRSAVVLYGLVFEFNFGPLERVPAFLCEEKLFLVCWRHWPT